MGRGPNIKTLRMLSGMLPSFAKGVISGKVKGLGRAVAPDRRPRKTCPICFAAYDYAPISDEFQPQNEICEKCRGLLNEGYTAFVCGGEFAFGKHPHLSDMAGTVQRLQPETFEKLRTYFRQQGEQSPGAA